MEPRERVELSFRPYQGRVLPLNDIGSKDALRRAWQSEVAGAEERAALDLFSLPVSVAEHE